MQWLHKGFASSNTAAAAVAAAAVVVCDPAYMPSLVSNLLFYLQACIHFSRLLCLMWEDAVLLLGKACLAGADATPCRTVCRKFRF
jgi:hypothetical protein